MFTVVTILSKASLGPDSTFTVKLLVDTCSVQAGSDTRLIGRNPIRCCFHKEQHLRNPLLIMTSGCHFPCFFVAHLALKIHHFCYKAGKALRGKVRVFLALRGTNNRSNTIELIAQKVNLHFFIRNCIS